MENTKKEIAFIGKKIKKLDSEQKEYLKGWMDAKLESKKEGAS